MANKYTRKGKTQEALPKEDEFVSFWEKVWQVVKPQMRNIGIGAAAICLILVAAWIVTWALDHRSEGATEEFARAVRIHEADLLPEDSKDKKEEKKPIAAGDDETPKFKTAKERAEATLAALDKLEKDHGGGVSRQAQLFRAGVLYELGRYDDAKKVAGEFAGEAGKGNPFIAIARENEGLSLESLGKLDEAASVFGSLADNGPDFFRERAMLDKARVLSRKGDAAGAKEIYKKIIEKVPSGLVHDEASNRLALLGG